MRVILAAILIVTLISGELIIEALEKKLPETPTASILLDVEG